MRKLVLGLIAGSAAGLALTAAPQPARAQGLLGALLGLGSPTYGYGYATLPTTAPGTRGVDRSAGTTLIARTGTATAVTRTALQSVAKWSRMARDMAIPTATPTADTGCPEKAPSGRSAKPIAERPRSGRQDQPLGGETEGSSRRPLFQRTSPLQDRRAEAQMQELCAKLLHVSRLTAMGQMASVLAHELNQPLAAASNYLSAAKRLPVVDGSRATTFVDKAGQQILRAGEIIERLRDFVSKGQLTRHVMDIAPVLNESVALPSWTAVTATSRSSSMSTLARALG